MKKTLLVTIFIGLLAFFLSIQESLAAPDLLGVWTGSAEGTDDEEFVTINKLTMTITDQLGGAFRGTVEFDGKGPYKINGVVYAGKVYITGELAHWDGKLIHNRKMKGVWVRFETDRYQEFTAIFNLVKE